MSKILLIFTTCLFLCSCSGSCRKDKEDNQTNDIKSETQHNNPEVREPQPYATIRNDWTSDGNRKIETEYIHCSNGDRAEVIVWGGIEVSLRLTEHSDGKLYWSLLLHILVGDHGTTAEEIHKRPFCFLPVDGRMLIKLDDGEVIELRQSLGSRKTLYSNTENYEYGRRVNVGSIYGEYSITENEIKKIVSHTVTKVRVERNADGYLDYNSEIRRFSKVVASEYELVLCALHTKKDFYSDF